MNIITPKDKKFIELCKSTERQELVRKAKSYSLDKWKEMYKDPAEAEKIHKAFSGSKEGYIKIRRISPEEGSPEEGWATAFGEGIPLHIDTPYRWYSTSEVISIDWESKVMRTKNSEYAFEFEEA